MRTMPTPMRRFQVVGASMAAAASLIVPVSVALPAAGAAGGGSSTSVVLQCDRGAGATAVLQLWSATGADQGQVEIWCGSDSPDGASRNRVTLPTPAGVATVGVSRFTGTFADDCATTTAVPATIVCPPGTRTGAKLTVR